jgi:hypothetical protein
LCPASSWNVCKVFTPVAISTFLCVLAIETYDGITSTSISGWAAVIPTLVYKGIVAICRISAAYARQEFGLDFSPEVLTHLLDIVLENEGEGKRYYRRRECKACEEKLQHRAGVA